MTRRANDRAVGRPLAAGSPARERHIRDAFRALSQGEPGGSIELHGEGCPMGRRCACGPVRLVFGARA